MDTAQWPAGVSFREDRGRVYAQVHGKDVGWYDLAGKTWTTVYVAIVGDTSLQIVERYRHRYPHGLELAEVEQRVCEQVAEGRSWVAPDGSVRGDAVR